ncbi:A1S_2505 family phage non-structural protein [Agrococcus beijingensis]|uniref:A1S_2505 family phage non-structural protein n=1 Tax=Agrococcus beijingensis TaxID=3068634 RepID=UPI00274084D5|nr:hypothetical protein [Agrococcus sp. REN33]
MWIDELGDNEVFVFGSNALGHHRGGAAKTARERFGAVRGQAHGLQGRSYAINSMSGLDALREEVRKFYAFAAARSDLRFLVTAIGTGIAGHAAADVAPLFAHPPANVRLPRDFAELLDPPLIRHDRLPELLGVRAPDYVDEFGNEILPGLMLGGPFDGRVFGMPAFGEGAPLSAGHPVPWVDQQDVVAWYELRSQSPIAERHIYEFVGFRDGEGGSVEIQSGAVYAPIPSDPLLDEAAEAEAANNTLAAVRRQVDELQALSTSEREQLRGLSANFYSGPHHEELWNIDNPLRTEARALRALADAFASFTDRAGSARPSAEHCLNQYLSRARYAQGRWDLASHSVEMGDYWWAVQLMHLIRARDALARQALDEALSALNVVVGSFWNGGGDFDYVLEGLTELAFLGDLGRGYPSSSEWAAVAVAMGRGFPGWGPGVWFTAAHRERLQHIATNAR